ncbi:MAG TPA: hypothetical protein VGQ21_17110 [Thermoanaerobaculia bacterium]|nr:hypothetical protein [Thermoanaerobaculia bacterium]
MNTSRYIFITLLLVVVSLPLAAQINDTYVIPASANAAGNFGTRWLTQFSVFNPQLDHPLTVSVTFLPTGGGAGSEKTFTVPANGTVLSDNILDDLFGIKNGSGALLVATFAEDNPAVPNDVVSRSFLVTTNTYNNVKSGTYGQTIPGVWAGLQDFKSDGISAVAHGIRNVSRLGWRTNVGAVNLGRSNVTLRINIYDADGKTIKQGSTLDIPALGHRQASLPAEVDGGSIEFFVDDPSKQAVVFPYSSTIDDLSGDPTYQGPTLLANAKVLFKMGMPQILGRKIDSELARGIRETATRLGQASVVNSRVRADNR